LRISCRVWILVIHYAFAKDEEQKRLGNTKDLELLRNLFKDYQDCSYKEIASPESKDIAKILCKEDMVTLFNDGQEGNKNSYCVYVLPRSQGL
jgi:hypothetical protein